MTSEVSDRKPSRASAVNPRRPADTTVTTKLEEVVLAYDVKSISHAGPPLEISLANARFASVVVLSLVVFVSVLLGFLHGVVIDKNVRDALGSTERVDYRIAVYQVVNGFVTALIGKAVEAYFTIFIVVAATFLRNVSWFPGDDPSTMIDHQPNPKTFMLWSSQVKKLLLWGFKPVVMYNLSVAITAMYVSHQTRRFHRNFLEEDLFASTGALNISELNAHTAANLTSLGNGVSVLDTILRGAVRQHVVPFEIDPNNCVQPNGAAPAQLPTAKELRSVSVSLGFPTRDWNMDAVPFGLVPTHAFNTYIKAGEDPPEDREQLFDDFQLQSNVSWLTMYELILQGKLLFERSVSDSDSRAKYDCLLSDRRDDLGSGRECFGAVSSLHDLDNMLDWDMQTVAAFMEVISGGFSATASSLQSDSTNLTVEVFDLTPQLKLTSMTLDIPYIPQFRLEMKYECRTWRQAKLRLEWWAAQGFSDEESSKMLRELCETDKYEYEDPRAACGRTNCILLDKHHQVSFKKQLQLMPYTVNCSTAELVYDEDFLNFFPQGCVPVNNAVFLYGLGSYVSGEKFESGYISGLPFIFTPRRHITLTFAKLEWQFEELHTKLHADCGINATSENPSPCAGLVYDLENVTVLAAKPDPNGEIYKRVLVLGKDQLPADRLQATYLSPVQLLSLTTQQFYYPKDDKFYEWEYLDLSKFKTTNWLETVEKYGGLNGTMCSGPVDAYISMFKTNYLYMDDARQPLYTAALFYLFQDAAVKIVKLDKPTTSVYFHDVGVKGTTALDGDLANHEIRFKIPLLSLTLSFVGLGFFLLLVVLVVVCPRQRLKMVEDVAESVARKYARFRQEDEYPEEMVDGGLKLPSGDRVALDGYAVDSLTLHHKSNRGKKIYL